ncbi:MAG: DUF4855 domain-containing protein [Ruminococcaceae bacterium]|nr:DUF4855 domain-containing protein [Oscillospiraceae bacterium]
MKKFLAFILSALMLISLVSCNKTENTEGSSDAQSQASSEVSINTGFIENKTVLELQGYLAGEVDRTQLATNVFYDRPYTLSRDASEQYPNVGSKLTNCQTMDLIYGAYSHVGWEGTSPVTVTIDAGEEMHNVGDIAVCCVRIKDYSYDFPQSVTVEVSNDGKKFTLLSTLYTPDELENNTQYTYYFSFPQAINARYYRIGFNRPLGAMMCVDEIFGFEYSENGKYSTEILQDIDHYNTVKDFYNYNLNLGESNVKVSESDADYNELRNLATIEGVEFQISHFDNLPTEHSNNGMEDIGMLTDGKYHGKNIDNDYFKFHRGGGRHVVADLGQIMSVKGLNLYFHDKYTWGISTPPVYYISVSENGTDWVTVFAEENPDYGKVERGEDNRICNFKQEVKARYVRLTFETVPANNISALVYLGEIEIMGRKNPENAATAVYDESIVYGNYPSVEKFGVSDILFSGIGDKIDVHCTEYHVITKETALEYLAVLDENGKATEKLMDSFALTTRNQLSAHPQREKGYNFFLDELFYDDVNLDAIEYAQAKINEDLGIDEKCEVWISVICPAIGDNFNGKSVETAEDYIECLKWQADEAIKRFNESGYKYVKLMGFYWQHETMRPHPVHDPAPAHDYEAAKAFNDYIHSLGYLSLWCPYYDCEGLYFNHVLGFDITCLQPNLMWYWTEPSRITSAAELAKLYGCGIEIEIECSAQSKESQHLYRDYIGTGVDYGFINAVNAYYQGAVPGAYTEYRHSEKPIEKEEWEETLLYVTGKLDKNYNKNVEKKDLSGFNGGEITVVNGRNATLEIGNLKGYTYRITRSPIYGFLKLNESGKLEYTALKGYKGEDDIEITVFDGVSEYKTVKIDVTVTE